jgi:hypothetical protein
MTAIRIAKSETNDLFFTLPAAVTLLYLLLRKTVPAIADKIAGKFGIEESLRGIADEERKNVRSRAGRAHAARIRRRRPWRGGKRTGRRDRQESQGGARLAWRRKGIEFCTCHSILDWHHPNYPLGSPGGKAC